MSPSLRHPFLSTATPPHQQSMKKITSSRSLLHQLLIAATCAASASGASWIGPVNGVSGSFAANSWVHLAVIRSAGVATFYINGIAQTGTYGGVPVQGVSHLSVNPGGTVLFDGLLDEARVVTFTSGESNSIVLNRLTGVPEPSSASLLGGLGLMGLHRHRIVA